MPPARSTLHRLLALAAAHLTGFGAVALYWMGDPTRPALDVAARRWTDAWTTPLVAEAMEVVTVLGSIPVTLALLLGLALWWMRRDQRRAAWVLTASVAAAELTLTALKFGFGRMRPAAPGLLLPDASFPSGHAFHAAFAYGLLALALGRRLQHRGLRAALGTLALSIVLLVGSSRLALDVHYATDVLGGLLLGGAWLAATEAALLRYADLPVSSATRSRR